MGKHTNIGWCNSTINGSSGCDGCELWSGGDGTCYAARVHLQRLARSLPALYAPTFDEVRMIPGRLARAANWGPLTPAEWRDKPWFEGRPRHIFVGDMGDFLSRAVTDEFLKRELLGAITSKNGKRHVWQLLTKRPARLADLSEKWGGLPDNVIAMTTITNQRTADLRIPDLLRVRCKWRGLSVEPLVEEVNLFGAYPDEFCVCSECGHWDDFGGLRQCACCESREENNNGDCAKCGKAAMRAICPKCETTKDYSYYGHPSYFAGGYERLPGIHWVICGGESGALARQMHPDWARLLCYQCKAAGVPFFFKQWGEWVGMKHRTIGYDTIVPTKVEQGRIFFRVGKHAAGRLLDGVEHNEIPEVRP